MSKKIGFISTRFAGSDGVSLESSKWAEVLWSDQHVSFWYSGRNDRYPGCSYCVPEAYFGHPENRGSTSVFGANLAESSVSLRIRELADYLKQTLYRFVEHYQIDLLIPLWHSMHVPLGIAVESF